MWANLINYFCRFTYKCLKSELSWNFTLAFMQERNNLCHVLGENKNNYNAFSIFMIFFHGKWTYHHFCISLITLIGIQYSTLPKIQQQMSYTFRGYWFVQCSLQSAWMCWWWRGCMQMIRSTFPVMLVIALMEWFSLLSHRSQWTQSKKSPSFFLANLYPNRGI